MNKAAIKAVKKYKLTRFSPLGDFIKVSVATEIHYGDLASAANYLMPLSKETKFEKKKVHEPRKREQVTKVKWTAQEVERLIKLHNEGNSQPFIASALGRPRASIASKLLQLSDKGVITMRRRRDG